MRCAAHPKRQVAGRAFATANVLSWAERECMGGDWPGGMSVGRDGLAGRKMVGNRARTGKDAAESLERVGKVCRWPAPRNLRLARCPRRPAPTLSVFHRSGSCSDSTPSIATLPIFTTIPDLQLNIHPQ